MREEVSQVMEEREVKLRMNTMKKEAATTTPTSSPPTPPSPLPISVGPGNQKYLFSPSPSPSPPFSPTQSTDELPLLHKQDNGGPTSASTFSLDRHNPNPNKLGSSDTNSSCLVDLLEWFIARCCNCCSRLSESSRLPI